MNAKTKIDVYRFASSKSTGRFSWLPAPMIKSGPPPTSRIWSLNGLSGRGISIQANTSERKAPGTW
jgi:hypothetical protein